jgi:UDPglucose 6-dehydrogenase
MNISIFGTGYVGLVSGACLAEVGHKVTCMDVDPIKVNNLNSGILPIWEPGLESLVKHNMREARLNFTSNIEDAVNSSQILIIAVGTPEDEDGSADLKNVFNVAREIASHMKDYKIIINKSTVPVGTGYQVRDVIKDVLLIANRQTALEFDVVSNPEFLKEGSAISDFLKPDRIIIGTESEKVKIIMRELYEPFNRNHERIIFMDVRSAELTKYAANAMLATKISFINELANIAERTGADIEEVRKGIGADSRIGYDFIYPGCGYGGSCFPKDVRALVQSAKKNGYNTQLLDAVEAVNNRQKGILFSKLVQHFDGSLNLSGKIIALWGLAFKPNTDDMREAPSLALLEALWNAGAKVQAFDPVAMKEAKRIYDQQADFEFCSDKYSALTNADALVICTEWQQFRSPDFDEMAVRMRRKVIVDGRNLYQTQKMKSEGWQYFSVGRVVI